MIIIGISGTLGAGKGTVVDYLIHKKEFAHFSARNFLTKELEKRGLEPSRDTFNAVANDLRRHGGPQFIAESLYKLASANGKNAIIESLHTPGEVSFLKQNPDFFLLAVDANLELRYERIVKRNSVTDHVTFEKFKSDNEREIVADNPFSQNISACIGMADAKVYNNGSVEELYASVDAALESFFKKENI